VAGSRWAGCALFSKAEGPAQGCSAQAVGRCTALHGGRANGADLIFHACSGLVPPRQLRWSPATRRRSPQGNHGINGCTSAACRNNRLDHPHQQCAASILPQPGVPAVQHRRSAMAIAVPSVGRERPSREAAGRMLRHRHNRDHAGHSPAQPPSREPPSVVEQSIPPSDLPSPSAA
jgi:hypothetical protein